VKKHLTLALFLCLSLAASATHIVGGFISYTFISGTTYEIKLTVYRDCNSTAVFDGTPDINGNINYAR
jgi:hypothetical protein